MRFRVFLAHEDGYHFTSANDQAHHSVEHHVSEEMIDKRVPISGAIALHQGTGIPVEIVHRLFLAHLNDAPTESIVFRPYSAGVIIAWTFSAPMGSP